MRRGVKVLKNSPRWLWANNQMGNPDLSMRTAVCIGALLIATCLANARTNYLSPDGWIRPRIKAVAITKERPQHLQVTFELVAVGKTPVAVAQDQFGILISKRRWYFDSGLSFTNGAPRIFTVSPDTRLTINATVLLTNKWDEKQRWIELSPGQYGAQIFIGSGKTRQFDYQWMGQMSSDRLEFEIMERGCQ